MKSSNFRLCVKSSKIFDGIFSEENQANFLVEFFVSKIKQNFRSKKCTGFSQFLKMHPKKTFTVNNLYWKFSIKKFVLKIQQNFSTEISEVKSSNFRLCVKSSKIFDGIFSEENQANFLIEFFVSKFKQNFRSKKCTGFSQFLKGAPEENFDGK